MVQSDYATLSAEKDMEERLAKDLGERITGRLSRYFGKQSKDEAAKTGDGAQ